MTKRDGTIISHLLNRAGKLVMTDYYKLGMSLLFYANFDVPLVVSEIKFPIMSVFSHRKGL